MRLILACYDALRSFDRPCTRRELEQQTSLTKDEVWLGLRALNRRGILVIDASAPRARALFSLAPGAPRPVDLRGKHPRTRRYSPARPPSHVAEPGALRTLKAALALYAPTPVAATPAICELERAWRRRR